MRSLTPQDVRDFWAFMQRRYQTTIIRKDDDLITAVRAAKDGDIMAVLRTFTSMDEGDLAGLVGMFLSAVKVMDVSDFMENYTTTLGDRIYVPYEIGVSDNPRHSLKRQILTCVHEHRHVKQFREDPIHGVGFAIMYLADRATRAREEAEAMRASVEVEWMLSEGTLTEAKVMDKANNLSAYSCSKEDIDFARKYLQVSFKTIKHGGSIDNIARVANRWLAARLA